MRIMKTVLVMAFLVIAGLFTFTWFTHVTEDDIYASLNVEFEVDPLTVTPGSILALSRNGSVSHICDLGSVGFETGPIEKTIVYNQLRQDFPVFVKAVSAIKHLFEDGESGAEGAVDTSPDRYTGREFIGTTSTVTNLSTTATQFDDKQCELSMAWHLSQGYRACTVKKVLKRVALMPDGSIDRSKTVAVTFAELSNFVTPEQFSKFDLPYTEAAAAANGQPCDGNSHAWPTDLKRKLNVIQRVTVSFSETVSQS